MNADLFLKPPQDYISRRRRVAEQAASLKHTENIILYFEGYRKFKSVCGGMGREKRFKSKKLIIRSFSLEWLDYGPLTIHENFKLHRRKETPAKQAKYKKALAWYIVSCFLEATLRIKHGKTMMKFYKTVVVPMFQHGIRTISSKTNSLKAILPTKILSMINSSEDKLFF